MSASKRLPFAHRLPWAGALVIALSVLSGCAGYKLGPSNGLAPGEKSVQINPFDNRTLQPRLTDAVTAQLRKELSRDGTFRIASKNDGDIIVNGVIVNYDRRELTFSPRDTLTVRDYRISIVAEVTALDRISGRMILNQRVHGFTLIRVGADLVSSERQATPLLAQDLARNVTALLADGSW